MSDRVAARVRLIAMGKKTPREKMASLWEASRSGPDNFAADELRELYGKHASLLLQVYQEFVAAADADASKGKLLTVNEAVQLVQVLKELLWANGSRIAAQADGWELAFWLKELPCFLHQECHHLVRRHGFEALATLIDLRLSPTMATQQQQHPPLASPGVSSAAVQQSTSSMSSTEPSSFLPWLQLLVSSFDWDFLRATYGSPMTLPNTIVEVRRGRHDCLPPRSRYAPGSAGASGGDDREREALFMLRRLIVDPLTAKGSLSSEALSVWVSFLLGHLVPLFMPTIAQRSGATESATLFGCVQGLHKKVHPLFVELVYQLLTRADLVSSERFHATLGATLPGVNVALWTLLEAVRDPCVEWATTTCKSLHVLTLLAKQHAAVASLLGRGPPTHGLGSDSSSSLSPSWIEAQLPLHVADVLKANTIRLSPELLLPCAALEGSAATDVTAVATASPLQALVESYAEWLWAVSLACSGTSAGNIVGASNHATSGATDSGNCATISSSSNTFWFPVETRVAAVTTHAELVSALAAAAARRPSVVLDEIAAYPIQSFWTSAWVTLPTYTSGFLERGAVPLHRLEGEIAALMSAASVASATGKSSAASTNVTVHAYLVKCWSALTLQCVKAFLAPSTSKLLSFAWPPPPTTPPLTGQAAAAASPLLEFRLRRSSIPLEWITRTLASTMTVDPDLSKPAELDRTSEDPLSWPFHCATEAIHVYLHNFEQDTYATQKSKTAVTMEVVKLFLEANTRGHGVVVEPDSLLKVLLPYLLLQSRLTELPVGTTAASTTAATKASSSVLVPAMSPVARDAIEALCDILVQPSACRVTTGRTRSESPPDASAPSIDAEMPGDRLEQRHPHITPLLEAVALDRLQDVLRTCRSKQLECDDVASRILTALFRNQTSTTIGRPTPLIFSHDAEAPFALIEELFITAQVLLEEPQRPRQTVNAHVDAKTAALNAILWSMTVDRRIEAPIDVRLETLVATLKSATRSGAKIPVIHGARTITLLLTDQLRRGCDAALPRSAAAVSRIETSILGLVELLLATLNVIDKTLAAHTFCNFSLLLDCIEDLLKRRGGDEGHGGAAPLDSTGPAAPLVQFRGLISKDFALLLYRRVLTALCGLALYHMYNWLVTRTTGDTLLQVMHLVGEYAVRIGHLGLRSYHADDDKYTVPLGQLVADVGYLSQQGTTGLRYAIGFPNAAREYAVMVSHVESAYQLMKDGLSGVPPGADASAARVSVATSDCALVMIPPQDESSRRWLGAATPQSTDVQADTLHPQQVVQAGHELLESLLVHTHAFPHPRPHEDVGLGDPEPDRRRATTGDHRALFAVGGGAQVVAVEAFPLAPQEMMVSSFGVVSSHAWLVSPICSTTKPALHDFGTSDDSETLDTERPVLSDTQRGAPPTALDPTDATMRRAPLLPSTHLDELLVGFEGTFIPPKELLEYSSAGVENAELSLHRGRYSAAENLVQFSPYQLPTIASAPLPASERNYTFPFLFHMGVADGHVPLGKAVRAVARGSEDGTNITAIKPAQAIRSEQVLPSDVFAPLEVSSYASAELASGLPTRTIVPPLACIIRTVSSSSAGTTSLPAQIKQRMQCVHEKVMLSFGFPADDIGMKYSCVTPRAELTVCEFMTTGESLRERPQQDSWIVFVANIAECLQAVQELKATMAGRSFVAICVVPSPTVADAVTVHVARQGEGAPQASPFADGLLMSPATAGFLLRSFLLASVQPWKQPLTVPEAKRRVAQRASRLFALQQLPRASSASPHRDPNASVSARGAGTPSPPSSSSTSNFASVGGSPGVGGSTSNSSLVASQVFKSPASATAASDGRPSAWMPQLLLGW